MELENIVFIRRTNTERKSTQIICSFRIFLHLPEKAESPLPRTIVEQSNIDEDYLDLQPFPAGGDSLDLYTRNIPYIKRNFLFGVN